MKVDWLNDDMTEALITKGILWWKRVSLVRFNEKGAETTEYTEYSSREVTVNWLHVTSNLWCDVNLDRTIKRRRNQERTWKRPVKPALPRAEVRR